MLAFFFYDLQQETLKMIDRIFDGGELWFGVVLLAVGHTV